MPKYLFFVLALALNTSGQILLKKGMNHLGEFKDSTNNILVYFFKCFTNIYILSGLFLYAMFTITWLILLSKFPLSLVYSVLSIGYVLILLVSVFIFHERISLLSWSGSAFILLGIFLFSLGMKGI